MVYIASPQGKILRLEGYAVAIRQLKIMVKGELNCNNSYKHNINNSSVNFFDNVYQFLRVLAKEDLSI